MNDAPAAPPISTPVARAAPMRGRSVSAGRGVVYVTAAKLYFMLAGAAIEIVLPRILGVIRFGAYAFVVSGVSVVNNVLVTGTIQTLSRFTTQEESRTPSILRAGLRMNLGIGAAVTVAYLAGAVGLCALEHDYGKLWLLWLAGGIPLCYALYAVLVGAANGLRQFHKQAGLDATFSTTRAALVLAGAAALGVGGAIGGFVVAAILILIVAVRVVGVPAASERADARPMARFLLAVAAYQIFLNLAMNVDLFFLKRFMTDAAHGVTKLADAQVGYYRAVQNVARLPYQALLAVTFIVFPLVSGATFADDRDAARRYVRDTLRYSLLGGMALAVAFAALPRQVLTLFYPSEFLVGARALAVLALGHVAFALFTIAGAVLNGAGETRRAIWLGAVLLAAQSLLCALLLPGRPLGPAGLFAAGEATAIAFAVGCAAAGLVLVRRFGAFVSIWTWVRATAAALLAMALGTRLPAGGKLLSLCECALVSTVFLSTLLATRELSPSDLRRLAAGALKR